MTDVYLQHLATLNTIIMHLNILILTFFFQLIGFKRCPCHIILKWDIPVLPLILKMDSLISKDIDIKSLLEFGQDSNP